MSASSASDAKVLTLAELGNLLNNGRITLTPKKNDNEIQVYINIDNVPRKIRVQIGTDDAPASVPFGLSGLYVKDNVPAVSVRRELSLQMGDASLAIFQRLDALLQQAVVDNAEAWLPPSKLKEVAGLSNGDASLFKRLVGAAYKPLVSQPKEDKYRPSVNSKFVLTDAEHREEYTSLGGKTAPEEKEGRRPPSTVLVWKGQFAIDPQTNQPRKGHDGKFVKALHRGNRHDLTKGCGCIPIVDIDPLSFNQGKFKSSLIVESILVYPQAQIPSENFQIPGGFVIVNDKPDVVVSTSSGNAPSSSSADLVDEDVRQGASGKRSANDNGDASVQPPEAKRQKVATAQEDDDAANAYAESVPLEETSAI